MDGLFEMLGYLFPRHRELDSMVALRIIDAVEHEFGTVSRPEDPYYLGEAHEQGSHT